MSHWFNVNGPDGARIVPIPDGTHTIGRQAGSWLLLSDDLQSVSRMHARVICSAGSCRIQALESTNGTVVNDEQLLPGEERLLADGAVIIIGVFRLEYHLTPVGDGSSADREDKQVRIASRDQPLFPGVLGDDSRYLKYLPGIYHDQRYLKRFLALLESILAPVEWTIHDFDLFLDPRTAPPAFLPWLANWFDIVFDQSWSEGQQRDLLAEAAEIFRRLGTPWALGRVLEIYTGQTVVIDDKSPSLPPFTFSVQIPWPDRPINLALVSRLIEAHKPAHTAYELRFIESGKA